MLSRYGWSATRRHIETEPWLALDSMCIALSLVLNVQGKVDFCYHRLADNHKTSMPKDRIVKTILLPAVTKVERDGLNSTASIFSDCPLFSTSLRMCRFLER